MTDYSVYLLSWRVFMSKHLFAVPQYTRPKTWAFFLTTLIAAASLSACDVFDSLAEADKTIVQQIQGSKAQFATLADDFKLPVFSRGIQGQDVLFLTAYEGTVRWNRSNDSFERFGGDLPTLANASNMYADNQGDLHFYDRVTSLYTLKSGARQWQAQAFSEILPEDLKDSQSVVWAVKNTGEEVAAVLKAGTQSYHFMKRQNASENFKPWFEWGVKQDNFLLGSRDEFFLQPNGDLLMTNTSPFKPFVIPAGTQKPVPIFDCSALINKHCGAQLFLRGNDHNKVYAVTPSDGKTQVYKLPENASFPVVPEALPVLEHLGKTAEILLDPKGAVFAVVTEKDAETIPVYPFVRDVSTLMQLQGNRWIAKKSFYPAPYPADSCCFIGPDNALYSAGFQIAAGSNFVGQQVYRLGF